MAAMNSFDVTSEVDMQEVDNALNQARKEVAQRYDFKGSPATVELDVRRTKDGHPRHPLYVRGSTQPTPFHLRN